MDATLPFFDAAAEREAFEARAAFLERQRSLRLDLAPGVSFQPETSESVEDQVRETLWAEGKRLESTGPGEVAEVRASFAALSPRRERGGWSLAATLMLGFEEGGRAERLRSLEGFPESLHLVLADGSQVVPSVDRGSAGPGDRLPAVLALRYLIPEDGVPVALRSAHAALGGRWVSGGLARWTDLA